jgi:hypothetical protein
MTIMFLPKSILRQTTLGTIFPREPWPAAPDDQKANEQPAQFTKIASAFF